MVLAANDRMQRGHSNGNSVVGRKMSSYVIATTMKIVSNLIKITKLLTAYDKHFVCMLGHWNENMIYLIRIIS